MFSRGEIRDDGDGFREGMEVYPRTKPILALCLCRFSSLSSQQLAWWQLCLHEMGKVRPRKLRNVPVSLLVGEDRNSNLVLTSDTLVFNGCVVPPLRNVFGVPLKG